MTTVGLPLFLRSRARRRSWVGHRVIRRLAADPQMLLAIGLVLTTLPIAALGAGGSEVNRVVGVSVEFLAAQALATLAAPHLRPTAAQRTMIGFARFALAILYVAVVAALLRNGEFRPTGALFIPGVAFAAQGRIDLPSGAAIHHPPHQEQLAARRPRRKMSPSGKPPSPGRADDVRVPLKLSRRRRSRPPPPPPPRSELPKHPANPRPRAAAAGPFSGPAGRTHPSSAGPPSEGRV